MADYEVKAPPNLRSVDCCATCVNAKHWRDGGIECLRFRRDIEVPDEAPWPYCVSHSDICDAFEREVRK